MKKARIFLSALAVITLVGGALAFRSHNAITTTLYLGTSKNVCSTTTFATTTTQNTGVKSYFGTSSNVCPSEAYILTSEQ
jgi:hypothetical protein